MVSSPGMFQVKRLSEFAILPKRGSALAAGYDLAAAHETVIPARGRGIVPTDLAFAIPENTYGRVAPRSGLTLKQGMDVGAGVVDADFRGPIGIILFNHSDQDFVARRGDRVAQFILERIETPEVTEVAELDETIRGHNGFGSTGIN
ncbi:hypothetical protein CXG81DRAFT_11021 [Caulochytrium protostelioides]|uniref:Deoxyuridine 5'-triphosphate nucleotidohydrolase n=1 Tax=Caulochytrium protostelioides TaxID=1555241 RepID=A0A4P9WYC4_9FUNG|nr:dUTP diphosphatase [Caulochytrium protostelioides]RKP02257.1 hypothetical protein CXG81DRAFT_11021 [Caulochytrium protostelioides]|eukprot:RKP02257.1 hypothetical protein CXG81DRAFT_11021 [Caulochytrium protostelioides]